MFAAARGSSRPALRLQRDCDERTWRSDRVDGVVADDSTLAATDSPLRSSCPLLLFRFCFRQQLDPLRSALRSVPLPPPPSTPPSTRFFPPPLCTQRTCLACRSPLFLSASVVLSVSSAARSAHRIDKSRRRAAVRRAVTAAAVAGNTNRLHTALRSACTIICQSTWSRTRLNAF